MTLVGSLLNANEPNFIRAFQDFLNNTPSFLHSGVQSPFFPSFFAGAFITAFDCDVANNNEVIFFGFDINPDDVTQRSLKVAALSDQENNQQWVARCYTIADGVIEDIAILEQNLPWLRFTQEDQGMVQDLIQNILNIQMDNLAWEEYKIFLVRDGYDVHVNWVNFDDQEIFNQLGGGNVNFTEIQGNLEEGEELVNLEGIANDNPEDVREEMQGILQYITQVYNQYNQALMFPNNRKSYYHGLVSGFLTNFMSVPNHNINGVGLYLELFMGEGYADIALLVRGQNNITDAVLVIIELSITGPNVALAKAHTRVNRCPVSSLSLNTTSQNAVCVGLDFNANPSFITNVEQFLGEEQSLMEILSELILEEDGFQQNVAQNVSNYLRFPSFGLPALQSRFLNMDNRRFCHVANFVCGNVAFVADHAQFGDDDVIHVAKHLFQYNGAMLLPVAYAGQPQLQGPGEDVNNYASAIVLHTRFNDIRRAIIFRIHNMLDYSILPIRGLQLVDLGLQPQDRLYEVTCNMNPNMTADDLPRNDLEDDNNLQAVNVNVFQYGLYLNMYNNQFFQGNLLQINDIGNLHDIAGGMMSNNWTSIVAYGKLMQGVSHVLFSLRFIVNRNNARGDGFYAVLHGAFHACIRPNKVIAKFQVGGGSIADFLLARNPASVAQESNAIVDLLEDPGQLGPLLGGNSSIRRALDNIIDTQPIGIKVRFILNVQDIDRVISEARRQIERYGSCRGYARFSDEGQVALAYAVFNNEEQQNPDTLILYPNAISVYPINRGVQM